MSLLPTGRRLSNSGAAEPRTEVVVMQTTGYIHPGATEIAAGTRDAVKVYGAGENEVRALDGVSVG